MMDAAPLLMTTDGYIYFIIAKNQSICTYITIESQKGRRPRPHPTFWEAHGAELWALTTSWVGALMPYFST
jgi:hypothetical protein